MHVNECSKWAQSGLNDGSRRGQDQYMIHTYVHTYTYIHTSTYMHAHSYMHIMI